MKMVMLRSAVLVSIAMASPVVGATERCSIHPPTGATDAQLAALARLSRAQAEEIALKRIHSHAKKTVQSGELEAERGCLIWSFDIARVGRSGVEEVQVDAGNGRVLSVRHESSRQEAAEAAKEGTSGKPVAPTPPK
ncbi:MAG TPA: PepSY domain-containing protein [Steroidobacteraceae bacterium]|nr:PepSY domain-containing protein [Steroidobacteraceae bacterium]